MVQGGSGGPGGWWIAPEVEILFPGGDVLRPDISGWRLRNPVAGQRIAPHHLARGRAQGDVVRAEPFRTLFGDD